MAASETLRTVLDAGNASRRLDELTTARVILKIAEQVHGAQQKAGAGKAIGPLTPSSITIEPSGVVKLGLAEPNAFAYAAPEQLGASEGDRRSDVWSLGVVMWEALTHSALFEGGGDDAIKAAVREQTIDPPSSLNANIPAELSAICMRALSRSPADRYHSAKVMGAEIEAVLEDAGYGDTDDKVREFMATLGQPKREPKLSTPPLMVTPAQGVGVTPIASEAPADMLKPPAGPSNQTAPGMVIPRGDATPAPRAGTNPITVGTRAASGTQPPKPSILDQEPTEPPSSMLAASAGSLGADTQRTVVTEAKPVVTEAKRAEPPTAASVGLSAAPLSPTSFAKPLTAAPPVASGANLASALANAGATPKQPDRSAFQTLQGASAPIPSVLSTAAAVPMAPVLPATEKPTELPRVTSAATAHGFASAAVAADALKTTELEGAAAYRAKIDQVATESAAKAKTDTARPKAELPKPKVAEAPTKELPKSKKTDPTPAPRKRAPTGNPDPASVVALPGAKGRESQEVLGGWGWGTDSHASIKEYEGDDELPTSSNKKTLIYIFGGLLGVAAIIVVLAFAFGGSNGKPKPQAVAMTTEGSGSGSGSATAIAYGSGVAYGSATGDPTGGSATGSGSGSADAISAAGSATVPDTTTMAGSAGSATTGSATVATGSATGSAVAIASTGSATMTGTTTTAANPDTTVAKISDKVATTAPIPTKTPDKPVKTPDKAPVKTPDKTPVKTPDQTHTTTAHDKHPATHDPVTHPHPVVAEGPSPTAKADAETAYRQGLQLFARGDANGALTSLRVSLASNPSYAPTWRGLGLVFEKMGEKDQARAAFKRYLQLAPSAGDADQIRNRMERLGS